MHEIADQAEAALDALVPRLRQFAVVAREEHLTRAAELLGVPQPTLSRSIARLEADLGVPLFTRPSRAPARGSLLPATASSLADPAVVAVPITTPKAARTIGITWPGDRPLTAPAAAFRDFALTYAGRLPR